MVWMTAEETAARLGVKVATVYAYVSRGALRSRKGAGSRASRFDSEEVEFLARRGRPRRTTRPPALDFVIQSGLTVISDRDLRYRGESALDLARTATFEEVAELLWTGGHDQTPNSWEAAPTALPEVPTTRDRLRLAVVLAAANDPFRADLATPAVTRRARTLIATMVAAVPGNGDPRDASLRRGRGQPSLSGTAAGKLWGRLARDRAQPGLVTALNAALVLLADHEMAASTLAARVAASARADPYAVVLAGLGALASPLHGGASGLAYQLIAAAEGSGVELALSRAVESYQHPPGFGHRVYPGIDPRARVLLDLIRSANASASALKIADGLIVAARRNAGLEPNIDLALAVLTRAAGMPEEAGEVIFTVARTAGWIAHAIEEYAEEPLRFRSRAVPRR